jgi:hypothetical protein
MEFQGRIAKVLPMRTGTSERTGNQWQALPFVFEYFEHDTDRYADSVVLETLDTNVIAGICSCCEHDATGNLVVENGEMKLTREIKCTCGFSHKVRTFTNQQGETKTFNDMRLYKIETKNGSQAKQQPAQQANAQQVGNQPTAAPFPPQVDQYGNPINQGGGNDDDLPF